MSASDCKDFERRGVGGAGYRRVLRRDRETSSCSSSGHQLAANTIGTAGRGHHPGARARLSGPAMDSDRSAVARSVSRERDTCHAYSLCHRRKPHPDRGYWVRQLRDEAGLAVLVKLYRRASYGKYGSRIRLVNNEGR